MSTSAIHREGVHRFVHTAAHAGDALAWLRRTEAGELACEVVATIAGMAAAFGEALARDDGRRRG